MFTNQKPWQTVGLMRMLRLWAMLIALGVFGGLAACATPPNVADNTAVVTAEPLIEETMEALQEDTATPASEDMTTPMAGETTEITGTTEILTPMLEETEEPLFDGTATPTDEETAEATATPMDEETAEATATPMDEETTEATATPMDEETAEATATPMDEETAEATPTEEATADATPTIDAATEDSALTISEINDNPNDFLGQVVFVEGEFAERLGDNSFRLSEAGQQDQNNQILVVLTDATDSPLILDTESPLQVSGVVRTFDREEFEEEFDLTFDDEELYDTFDGRPVIVAELVAAISNAATGSMGYSVR